MISRKLLDSARAPGDNSEMCLYERNGEFSIRVNGCELVNSRVHGSEDALSEFACARITGRPSSRILIGGLYGRDPTIREAFTRSGPPSADADFQSFI
jgi:spermidine synthase